MKALIKKQLFDGKFDIQGEIAKGQTGTILYGYDLDLRQEVAIKIYHSHINGRLIRGKAFVEKSKPLLRLDHPNLIKLFKVEEENDTAVVFMEFFDAPSLQQLIHDKGTLSVQDMLMLAREIAEVLVHTHFQGIIHGTLHPGHVLVGPQGQIKVMDLGLSWLLMDLLSDGDEAILRPLPYFPPEIAKEELLNVSSDLYALGFMMYEMITGTVPYAGLPKTSIMGKLAFDQADPEFDFPKTVPEAICDLIREMTRNKTQQRLQDATHVLTIISQQLSKLPLSKTSKFLPPEAPQPRAQTQEETTEPTETSGAPLPSALPKPSLKREPPIQRPKSPVNYGPSNSSKILSKIGIILALIIVIGIAGTVGYWYRDFLEPHFPILQSQRQVPSLNPTLPQTKPVDSEIPSSLAQDSLKTQASVSELASSDSQALGTPSKATIDSTADIAPLSPELNQQPANPTLSQRPEAENTQQKRTLPTIQKQPTAKKPLSPMQEKLSTGTPIIPEVIAPPSATTIEKAPLQQSTVQQPAETKAQQETSLAPNQKQLISEQPPAPVKDKPSALTPSISESAPVSSIKSPKTELIQ